MDEVQDRIVAEVINCSVERFPVVTSKHQLKASNGEDDDGEGSGEGGEDSGENTDGGEKG